MNILLHKLQYYFSLATLYFKEGTTIETGFTTSWQRNINLSAEIL